MKKSTKILSVALIIAICAVMFAACGGGFDSSNLESKLDDLNSKYEDLQTKYNTLQTELNAKQAQIEQLLSDVGVTQSQLENALAELEAIKAMLELIKTELLPVSELTYCAGNWNGEAGTYVASNRVRTGQHYVELGEYPRDYVGDTLNATLEEAYNGGSFLGGMTATDKSYTSNGVTTSGTYTPKTSFEYSYNGQRYVRVSILSYDTDFPFSTGTNNGASGTIRWFKVEPIKWLIANWEQLPKSINPSGTGTALTMHLIAAEIITAGIPFNASGGSTLWENSFIRTFLNGAFINEAFDAAAQGLITEKSVPNNTTAGNVDTIGDGVSTMDKIFLPSYYEVYNASGMFYGLFDDTTNAKREAKVTDFAIANYGDRHSISSYDGNSYWRLRSASSPSYVRLVYGDGSAGNAIPSNLGIGLCPAFVLALS